MDSKFCGRLRLQGTSPTRKRNPHLLGPVGVRDVVRGVLSLTLPVTPLGAPEQEGAVAGRSRSSLGPNLRKPETKRNRSELGRPIHGRPRIKNCSGRDRKGHFPFVRRDTLREFGDHDFRIGKFARLFWGKNVISLSPSRTSHGFLAPPPFPPARNVSSCWGGFRDLWGTSCGRTRTVSNHLRAGTHVFNSCSEKLGAAS